MLIDCKPDQMRAAGFLFEDGQSRALRERDFYVANAGKYLTVSAWGDWYAQVPPAKTLVLARRCVGVDPRGSTGHDESYFLVDEGEYDLKRPDGLPFVIDESRHQRCANKGTLSVPIAA